MPDLYTDALAWSEQQGAVLRRLARGEHILALAHIRRRATSLP